MNMENAVIFEGLNLHKTFGPTIALKDVDIQLSRGEIRGLIGENGSGKSTIMSIAVGMQSQTSGEMYYKGEKWEPKSMIEAQHMGISMILQEPSTIPAVTVAQNIFAGREKEFTKFGIINMKNMIQSADAILKDFGIDHIKAKNPIENYNLEDRKLIEIARSVSEGTEILVVDETTTALSIEGRQILYKLIRRMANAGKSVVFISHDLDEILQQCDVITVLRDGEIIGHLDHEDMQQAEVEKRIRYMMVGREIGEKYYREDYDANHTGEVALELRNVSFGALKNFNLTLHKGEIIGFGGLSSSGIHDVGRVAFGLEKLDSGEVWRNGKAIEDCMDAIQQGMGYIPKNRDQEALIMEGSIQDNLCLPSLRDLEKTTFIHPAEEKRLSNREIDFFNIKANNGKQWVRTLSGGNKQKVSFGKWTAKDSEVIIMDCPTRGVDVGVKQTMYTLIEQMKREGKAILMISEELPELIGMVDKLIIMKNHQITKEFVRSEELRETDIIEYMI